MGGVAASGGYIVALGADRIFARPTTITGSIGVIFQWMSAKELVKKIGLEPHAVRSGSLKARPDFFEPPNLKTRQHIKEIVQKTFDWFIDLGCFKAQHQTGGRHQAGGRRQNFYRHPSQAAEPYRRDRRRGRRAPLACCAAQYPFSHAG